MKPHPIITSVANHTEIPVSAILEKAIRKPRPDVSRARALAAILLYDMTGWAYGRIGVVMNITAPGVWKACKRAKTLCAKDRGFASLYDRVKRECK